MRHACQKIHDQQDILALIAIERRRRRAFGATNAKQRRPIAGTATIVVRAAACLQDGLGKFADLAATFSIIPTTTMSAVVKRLIMPRRTDLPTPDPAMMPILWPAHRHKRVDRPHPDIE